MTLRHIALDTETTGLTPGDDRIIEIAAIDFDPQTGLPTGNSFHRYINPEQEIPPEVSAVHGKTWDDLKGEPLFKDIVKDFIAFVEGQEVVIHNARFDVGHLNAELKRVRKGTVEKIVAGVTDTLVISRRHTTAKVHTLDALCDRYGVDRSKRTLHGAFVDCEMLAAVYPPLLRDANQLVDRLNAVLPFKLEAPLCETMQGSAERSLVLSDLIKVLERERNRYLEHVRARAEGLDYANELFTVEFTQQNRTDWKKVQAEHLAGVDLKPYQTSNSVMTVKYV